jgi:ABC-type Fe3+-siderophore transport system permease subunit
MKKVLFGTLLVIAFFMFGGTALVPLIIPTGVVLAIVCLGYDIFLKDKVSKRNEKRPE